MFWWISLTIVMSLSASCKNAAIPSTERAEKALTGSANHSSSSSPDGENTQEQAAAVDPASGSSDEEKVLPTEVSGAYLFCHAIVDPQKDDNSSDTYRRQFGCGMASDQDSSPLFIGSKSTESSKALVKKLFAFSVASPSDSTKVELKEAPSGSTFDFVVSVSGSDLGAVVAAVQNTKVQVDYHDQGGKVAGGISSFVSDAIGIKNSTLPTTPATPDPTAKTALRKLRIPGVALPDGTVEVLSVLDPPTLDLRFRVHSLMSSGTVQWGLGAAVQKPDFNTGTAAALVRYDENGKMSAKTGSFGTASRFLSGRLGTDGSIYAVGSIRSTVATASNVFGWLITKFGPDGTELTRNIQTPFYPASVEAHGIDLDSNGNLVVVGRTGAIYQGFQNAFLARFSSTNLANTMYTLIGTPGDLTLNDIVVMPNGRYLVTGQVTRPGCDQSDGVVLDIPPEQTTDSNGNATDFLHLVAGTLAGDSFHAIELLGNGKYRIDARMNLAGDPTANPQFSATPGLQEVKIYLDQKLKIEAAMRPDGTPVQISDYTSVYRQCI